MNVNEAPTGLLWQLVFRPFASPEVKEEAREELRRRGRYGAPIEAQEKESE